MATQTAARTGEYEVMFLASQSAAAQLGGLLEHINEVIARANAEVIAMKKWDDRRLAYEIDKQKRGVYILAYVRCPTDQVAHIERDVAISEQLLRVLITTADHLTEEEMLANDQRQALADEARMKGQEVAEADNRSGKVMIGAPEQQQQQQQAEPAGEGSGDDTKDSDSDA